MNINELLLNPNLAYLLLVIGSLLAIVAMFSPGTGILEISAVFILIVAGWQVYNLPINIWALLLLILGVIPFIIAVRRSKQLIYLAAAILTLIIGSSFLFRGEQWYIPAVNPILATVTSVITASFMWFAIVKVLEADRLQPSHDLGSLIGVIGEARTEIHAEGTAQVGGELWSARSNRLIPADAKVRVIGREGLVLIVEIVP